MNNRILISLAAAVLAFGSQTVSADGWRNGDDDWGRGHGRARGHEYARVVRVEPIVQRHRHYVPVQHCWTETRYHEAYVPARADRTGAAIVGGVAGAVIGSQFGRGDERAVATVAGAAIGAAVGHEAARRSGDHGYYVVPHAREIERCRTRQEVRHEERVVAYRVTYVYNGRHQVTQMPFDPGRRIRVGVDVHPLY